MAKNVRSRIVFNTPYIKKITKTAIKALEKTAEDLHGDIVNEAVMPKDTGYMEEASTFVDYSDSARGSVKIVTSTPYARRLYYHPEYHFRTHENANAQGKWFSPWLTGANKDDIQKYFSLYMKHLKEE